MSKSRHEPYAYQQPPQGGGLDELKEYLQNELQRIERAFNGTDLDVETRWDDIRVPLESSNVLGVNAPDYTQLATDGAGSQGVYAYAFDAAAEEEVFFAIQLPHSYKEGSTLRPHLHWIKGVTASAAPGWCVVWGLEYWRSNVNQAFPANTTTMRITSTCTVAPNVQQIASFGDITASDATVSHMIMCRLFRDATNGGDTFTADASVLEFDVHFEMDAAGSEQEFFKA